MSQRTLEVGKQYMFADGFTGIYLGEDDTNPHSKTHKVLLTKANPVSDSKKCIGHHRWYADTARAYPVPIEEGTIAWAFTNRLKEDGVIPMSTVITGIQPQQVEASQFTKVFNTSTEIVPVHTVRVKFDNNTRLYDFLCDLKVTEGQKVVVDCANGLQVVEVRQVKEQVTPNSTKWLVDVVNDERFHERRVKQARMTEIKRDLDKRLQHADKLAKYQALATIDPEAAKLLAELQGMEMQQLVWDNNTPK